MPAQRRTIIEISPPVPSAVPPIFFERFRDLCCLLPPVGCARLLAATIRQRTECRQRGMKKPTEPYTLPFATYPHPIHTVVPISSPDKRQTMHSDSETRFKCTRAMLVERPLFV